MSVSVPLAGKTVFITGAGGGIGLETARALARMGAGVVLAPRDAVRGRIVADEIERAGGPAEVVSIDLGSFASIRASTERFLVTHTALDVLVNNAGIVVRDR